MAAFTPLTDIDTVKAILSITTTDSDTILMGIVDAVSAVISQYCNRNFVVASYTENYNGSGGPTLWLRQRPIISVAAVSVNLQVIPQRPNANAGGFTYDLNMLYLNGGIFSAGAQNVAVTYMAGIAPSADATPDLWQAAAEWAAAVYMADTKHVDKGSISSGEGQSTVFLKDMPWHVRRAVDPYRQVASVGGVLGV